MKQALYGTAAPNEKVTITSAFGEVGDAAPTGTANGRRC